MSNPGNPSIKLCPAMIEAGITDPESHEGVLFCAGSKNSYGAQSQCPYPLCVVFESDNRLSQSRERKRIARGLWEHHVSVGDIVLILNVRKATVRGYLKNV